MPRRTRRITTVVILAIIAALAAFEILGVLSDARQQRGVITVVSCFFSSEGTHSQKIYDCSGTFVADKGPIGHGIGLDFVNFTNDGDLAPGAKVAALVSGPDDNTATEASESRFRLYLTGGFSVLLLLVLVGLWNDAWQKSRRKLITTGEGQTGPH